MFKVNGKNSGILWEIVLHLIIKTPTESQRLPPSIFIDNSAPLSDFKGLRDRWIFVKNKLISNLIRISMDQWKQQKWQPKSFFSKTLRKHWMIFDISIIIYLTQKVKFFGT